MQVNSLVVGKTYKNKTWNYLAPCLRFFGDDFMTRYSELGVFALGLADGVTISSHKGKCIYIMFDILKQPSKMNRFLEWVALQDYYVKDYSASGKSLEKGRKRMVVLELPKELNRTYDAFIAGRYSLMFEAKHVKKLFTDGERREFAKVLKRDMEALGNHTKNINKEFDCALSPSDCLHHEYDTPPEIEEEIFNSPPNDAIFISSLEQFKIEV